MIELSKVVGLTLLVLCMKAGATDPRQFGLVADDTSRTSLRFKRQHIESPRGPREIEIIDKDSYSLRQAQYFSMDERLAYVALQVPYVAVDQAFENSRRKPAQDEGIGDVMLGFGIGVYRMPALDREALKNYDKNGLSSGCGVQIAAPTASYVKNQSVNVSSHRWMVIPECQLGWTQDQWVLEGIASMNWFSDNTDYKTGTFQQDNIYSMKAMVSYSFIPEAWIAATLEYENGGAVTRGGKSDKDGMKNWLAGAAINFRLPGKNSLRLVGELPISTAKGASESKEFSVVFSHVW